MGGTGLMTAFSCEIFFDCKRQIKKWRMNVMEGKVLQNINLMKEEMFLAERKVADYILANPQEVVRLNVTDLAERSGSSDATVIRMCKRLGYGGFYQMKLALAEELGRYQMVGYMDSSENPRNAKEVIQCLTRDLLRIADLLDEEKVQRCADMICASNRVFVSAVGNTIPVAMDFAFRLCRLGINATCETIVEYGMASMVKGSRQDMLLAISHSGSSKHVIQTVELAARKQMPAVAVTGSSSSTLARRADFFLLTTVENPLFGEYGSTSHIYEQAVLDSVLYLVSKKQKQEKDAEGIEALLAEYKI